MNAYSKDIPDKSKWENPEYLELLEFIEAIAIAKILSGTEVSYGISRRLDRELFTYRLNNSHYLGFNIDLHSNGNVTFEIDFNDKKFNSSGFKGNARSEGFVWKASNNYNSGAMNYVFNLDGNKETQIKQIKRLFRYFRKYI